MRDLPTNAASQHVVSAVVSLARGFGQRTVAEGVEDEETRAMLLDLGVDYAQGYLIAKPAPGGRGARRLRAERLERDLPEREPAGHVLLEGQLGAHLGLQPQLALRVAVLAPLPLGTNG